LAGSVAELRPRRIEKHDADMVEFDSVDWDTVEPVKVELDPALIEHIRARRHLKQITLRVGVEQIQEARRVAARTGLKYQAVLRRWLAEGASLARSKSVRQRRARAGCRAGVSRPGS
jgi:predicted DNA binding CopG/RHH family protein